MKSELTIEILKKEASKFAEIESEYDEPSLYGVTDGKAVGTYLEHKFTAYLANNYLYAQGNSASGIDIPGLGVDIKSQVLSNLNRLALLSQLPKKYMA